TLPILSADWLGANALDEATLTAPLGSGPYAISDYRTGQYVTFARRTDYWAWDLPILRGRFNFAEFRYEYFKERVAELEGLKAAAFDLREEFTSRDWANAYDIPAVRNGLLIRATLPDGRPGGTQGFFLNTRRPHLSDPRVRRALDHAFDFEWTNRDLFFGLYDRTVSFFQNSDLEADGMITPEEAALLEPFRAQLPDAVFTQPAYVPPKSNGSGRDRRMDREADRLFREAGWVSKGGKRVNARGKQLSIEFLTFSPSIERIISPYIANLKRLGVAANIRRVDPSQYEDRVKRFDFDATIRRFVFSPTPGPVLNTMFSSRSADTPSSFNMAGVNDPVVDALIERSQSAKSRAEFRVAMKALDRVLRAGHYWVSNWYKAAHNVVYWDKFGKPDVKPTLDRGIIETWWYDDARAAALAAKRAGTAQ
ncbi:MAG: extracellular solute-binding protein, partial [Pseudomonadota bacterium]